MEPRAGKMPAVQRSFVGEGVMGGADVEGVRIHEAGGSGDVALRDAVLPGEVILVPQSPEEAEHQRGGGEQVAKASPQKLARIRECAVEADDGQAAKLHSRSGPSECDEQEKVLRVQQVERGETDDGVHFFEQDLAAERMDE